MFDISKQKKIIDVVKYRWVWLLISLILIMPGVLCMIYMTITSSTHTPLKVGIDFTGGTIIQYMVHQDVKADKLSDIRKQLEKIGIRNPVIQVISNSNISNSEISNLISIRTQFIDDKSTHKTQEILDILKSDFSTVELVQVSSVGPTLGKELFKNSIFALLLAFVGIVIYLSVRFKSDYAVIALFSLLHDALFVIGLFSILGLLYGVQIDSLFITAILTVIGFSVHDTIVVYDRIRENLKYFSKKLNYSEIVNISVNQTLTRSINTSLTTVLTLLALYFFGGSTTKDFVLAMLLGIIAGTYSSIFFASVLLAWHHERLDKKNLKKA